MSKITKKQLHNGWHCHDTEIIKMKKELRELKQSVLRLEKLTDEKLLDEPQLKQLEQSVFDGAHEMWKFAAVDADGALFRFAERPDLTDNYWANVNCSRFDRASVAGIYDASDWQNSLIERDTAKELLEVDLSSELTGSDLARAMLARGDKCVMIRMGARDDKQARGIGRFAIATSIDESGRFNVMSDQQPISKVDFAVPINNQGEPLTAAEAGL